MNARLLTRRDLFKTAAAGTLRLPAAAGSPGLDARAFANPGSDYRGVTLWMLNDRIDPDEAERQLRGFHEAGWGGVITRTFMGTRIEYLGRDWLELTRRIVNVSREQGTRVFLQQADTKVGGYVATALPGMEDSFRNHMLVEVPAGEPPAGRTALIRRAGDRDYYEFTAVPPGDAAQMMAVMDLLDESAVRAFLERSYEPQAQQFGRDFGTTIRGIWMDEPFIVHARYAGVPALPWTARFPELFERDWGYSILNHLPALFAETGDYRKVRHHFWRTAVAQFKRAYWEPVGRWCAAHDVAFTGHLMGEDTLHDQIAWSGAVMPFYEDMQLPGVDYLTKDIATWRPVGSKFILTPKQLASVANQLGKPALCEMYAVSDQNLTFEDRKWIAQWLGVLGINYRCYHGSFYSLRGVRKRIYPPHLSYQQPWWPENRRIADPMARLSYALSEGRYHADALVVHPLETAYCEFDPAREESARETPGRGVDERLARRDRELITLSENLLASQRGFDYGDEFLLGKYGRVDGRELVVGRMRYRVVILPSLITLRQSTFALLKAFADAGGTLLSVGDLPTRIDGVEDPRIHDVAGRAQCIANSTEGLARAVPSDLELEGDGIANIWLHERRVDGARVFCFANISRTATVEAEMRLREVGTFERWNIETGEVEQLSDMRLRFAPAESHVLVFRPGKAIVRSPRRAPKVTRTVLLGGTYRIRRHDPNALTLDFCRYQIAGSWSEPLPVVGVTEKLVRERYRGPLRQEYRFEVAKTPSSCSLAVEDTEDCRIEVNGSEVRRSGGAWYRDRSFHVLPLPGLVRAGENRIEIAREFRSPDRSAIRDHSRFYGTDLEALYLIGDFAVKRRPAGFALDSEPAETGRDLIAAGYPFYAGRITLRQNVRLWGPAAGERVTLDFGALHAIIATVRVNGKEAGAAVWAPYRVDITAFVRLGINQLEIELVNSLRNLLGPHHYTGPRKKEQWGWSYSGVLERPDWMEPQIRPLLKTWNDSYEFSPWGVAENACITYERI